MNAQKYRVRPLLCLGTFSLMTLTLQENLQAQGCVAVRGSSHAMLGHYDPTAGLRDGGGYLKQHEWQVGLSYRWLHSNRHFVGDEEQKERQEDGTEVINDSHFFDVNILYAASSRVNIGLTVPFVHSDRSSLYEHKGNASGERYHTQAGGLGDVRLLGYYWFWDPDKNPMGNLSLGIGPKFPTGDYEAMDTFTTTNGPVVGPVDQSIQPGDGGWGIVTELTAFRQIAPRASLYLQGGYLFNPQGDNGVSTGRGRPVSNPYTAKMSIPDQYFARGGASYMVVPQWGLSLSLGARIEGVPAHDAIGDSEDFRRPGYTISIEPSLTLARNKWLFNLSGPVAVYRNRTRSVPDEQRTNASTTGQYFHGDAAFADFVILASISRIF